MKLGILGEKIYPIQEIGTFLSCPGSDPLWLSTQDCVQEPAWSPPCILWPRNKKKVDSEMTTSRSSDLGTGTARPRCPLPALQGLLACGQM